MEHRNYGGPSFYTLLRPVEIKLVGANPTSAPLEGLPPLKQLAKDSRPAVVITGRGKTAGRVSTLVRLRPEVVNEIKSLVDGPLYLTIELALRHYAQDLRKRAPGSVEMIPAADLG